MNVIYSRQSLQKCLRIDTIPDVAMGTSPQAKALREIWDNIGALYRAEYYSKAYLITTPAENLAESQEYRYGELYLRRLLDVAITEFLHKLQETPLDASAGTTDQT